jgi:hypothetical protein
MKYKKLKLMGDLAAAVYISYCFFRSLLNSRSEDVSVVFSRGAFRRDIESIGRGTYLVVIQSEWLRRLFRLGVADSLLEQVICLSYRRELRLAYPLALWVFKFLVTRTKARIIFGGVDYFEVAIFARRDCYHEKTSIEAVFHENYAITYVYNSNLELYKSIQSRFLFDRLYTYGPPATNILKNYTLESSGPRAMVMPRLAKMADDMNFVARLARIDQKSFKKSMLLLAFPGAEYLAPLCFTSTMLVFARLGRDLNMRPIVKFKSLKAANVYIKQTYPMNQYLQWIGDGAIEDLVWQAAYTVVFNSISLYEALLSPTIVIVPMYLDATHDENLLQETLQTISDLCGDLKSVIFVKNEKDIESVISLLDSQDLIKIAVDEREKRKKIVRNKFYLEVC